MNVSVDFPAEIEQALRQRAAAVGQDVETFVRKVVTERLADDVPAVKTQSHEEFMAKLRRFIELHPTSTWPVDDGRESIYAGRGE